MAKKNSTDTEMDSENVTLVPYDESQRNKHHQGGDKGVDSEEEDDDPRMRGGGQRVQCAQ